MFVLVQGGAGLSCKYVLVLSKKPFPPAVTAVHLIRHELLIYTPSKRTKNIMRLDAVF